MFDQIRKFFKLRSEEGATAVEYGIMVALIAAVIIAVVVVVGQQTCEGFQEVSDKLEGTPAVEAQDATCA